MFKYFTIVFLLLFSLQTSALVVEPFAGAQLLTKDGDNSKVTFGYGVQVGTLLKRMVLSAEYQASDMQFSSVIGADYSLALSLYSGVLTVPISPTSKLYLRYSPYFKLGESSYNKGTAFGVGFGYRVVRRLFINFDYTSLNSSTYVDSAGNESSRDVSYSKFAVFLSLPLNF